MDTKRPTKKKLPKWLLPTLALVLLPVAVWTLRERSSGAGYPVAKASLAYGTVTKGPLRVEVLGNGLLLPATVAQVSSQSAGTVDSVHAKPGRLVKAGELLLNMSNLALLQAAEELRWALAAQQAEVAALAVRLRNEQLTLETSVVKSESAWQAASLQFQAEARLIAEHGQVIADVDHQRSRLTAEQLQKTLEIERHRLQQFSATIKAEKQAADAKLEQTRQQLQRAEQQVAALAVRAPIDGVVQTISVEPGQRVDIGVTVAKVVDPQSLYAELKIPEQQARDLALDQRAEIDTRNGLVKGVVIRIDPAVRAGMVHVDIALHGELPLGARPDLSVDGRIEIASLDNALFVARPAHTSANQQSNVYRLIDSEAAERVPVQYGIASVNLIEIKSGLKPGDRILLNDSSLWGDPARLQLN
ncbi:efflux RND transporter periplasmic adaptor subunit [Permianibacter aggregans]|uniref:RND family efflux transporter MFP subunit n=1 Tax=Permianibacter aggregans TaxID=1510150 RepID=A0A4V3D7P0_9GAMM|nr:HlyD family efflux transporter periplasmic adaptor subunit [Permianibacter aggregans]QGX40864.1 HlyD family efflux transporter periplasmic adaptor subunit [Permianibacter aggregans]TDQ48317.1 RND family efflux transporter MFP subunit [Permianibacter aggregans]